MLRLVLDTDVVYCSVFSNGASSIIFDDIVNGNYKILYSNTLLTEYESVLLRNCKNKQEMKDVDNILKFIIKYGEKVLIYYFFRMLAKNIKDAMVVDTVINGSADYLITFNKRHYHPIKNTKILKPAEFLKEVTKND